MMEHMEHLMEHPPIPRKAKRHAGWNTWNRWNTQKTPRAYANTRTRHANKNSLTCARPLFYVFHLFYLNKNKRLCEFSRVPSSVPSVPSPVPSQKTTKQGLAMKEINLSRLPQTVKRPVWESIQNHAPALAALISSEPLREAVAAFDGEVTVRWSQLPEEAQRILQQQARDHL